MNRPSCWKIKVRIKALLLFLGCFLLTADCATAFTEETAGFAVKVREEICPYKVLGVYVLPREHLSIEVVQPRSQDSFILTAEKGQVTQSLAQQWAWRAPEIPGLYPVKIQRKGSEDAILLNVFVMIPYDQLRDEYVNGYQIGSYPIVPLRNLEIYRPPKGFIKLTRDNEATLISPHFTLKEFACKQKGGYPKCAVLRERLLLKLEYLLQVVNDKGYRCENFVIMSGFRTPHYNAAIDNVKYSRHTWGDAADIFIDENPKDGMMDDLNHDGRIDEKDADVLYDLINSLQGKKTYGPFEGGLGRYGSTSAHGPFVHVDARGFQTRWGR